MMKTFYFTFNIYRKFSNKRPAEIFSAENVIFLLEGALKRRGRLLEDLQYTIVTKASWLKKYTDIVDFVCY